MPTSKRLADILDETVDEMTNAHNNPVICDKFIKLKALWKEKNGNYDIDNSEIRWIDDRLDKLYDGKTLTKNDLLQANLYWKKYK